MKNNYIILSVIIVILIIISSVWFLYRNNDLKTGNQINLDSSYNNESINVKKDDIINITLSNPGSGGYQFDDPEFDTNILKMLSHNHSDPNTNLVGNFGEDIWKFEATNLGQSEITFYISRSWEQQKEIDFKVTINIQ